jgi:hypothetical protein
MSDVLRALIDAGIRSFEDDPPDSDFQHGYLAALKWCEEVMSDEEKMIWEIKDENTDLGLIPFFVSHTDKRSVKEQFNANYQHGGGWRTIEGFEMDGDCMLKYPGDPPLEPIAFSQLRDEAILVYPYGIVVVMQRGGEYEAARLD